MTLVNAETGEIVSTNSATYWADRIRPNIEAGNIAAAEAIERWIDAGNDLIEAKASVAHGEWLPLLNVLGISAQDANRYASIASNTAIANFRRGGNLPQGVTVLGELAKVDPAILEDAIDTGTLTPATTKLEARQFARSTQRSADDIEPGDKIVDDDGALHLVAHVEDHGDELAIIDDEGDAIITSPDNVVTATPKKSTAPTKPDLGDGISHPARYSTGMVEVFAALLNANGCPTGHVLDPFAGTGRIHQLREHGEWITVGNELEPEWAAMHPDTIPGDARDLPFEDSMFSAIVTSPTYGNRLADSHNASDPEKRRSYTHDLGRTLTEGNSGAMHWGPEYRAFHAEAWIEALRVLRSGGLFVLNIKDHIRDGERQRVTGWHIGCLEDLGLTTLDVLPIETPSLRAGANAEARCTEIVVVMA